MFLRPHVKRVLKVVQYGTIAAIGTSTLYVLHNNDYDVSSIGIVRFSRALYVATRIVVDYKWSLYGLENGSDKYVSVKSTVHKRSAERLLKLAQTNGGVWIKVGQHCGALDYLLPSEYVQTLSILHSKAPESSYDDVCRVIKEDLGVEPSEIFSSVDEQRKKILALRFFMLQPSEIFSSVDEQRKKILALSLQRYFFLLMNKEDIGVEPSEIFSSVDEKPIGAASLAQVHKAVLQNGAVVALKVQHRRVKPNSFVDTTSMEFLIRCVALLFPEFKLMWLVEEMKKNLPSELDFINEGQNTDRVRRIFSHLKFLKIPEIHWDHSSDRILIMEFCEGGQINDLEYIKKHKINPDDVCRKLGQLYSEMIFVQGYVHCDPHPGNVLVYKHPKKGQQIVLLDHGLYTTLDEDFRLHYANLWLALLKADLNKIKEAAMEMGVGELYGLFACMVTARSWQSVQSGIDKQTTVSAKESDEIKQFVQNYLAQISDVLSRVPRPMLLIFKTNDLLRGIEYSLKVQKNAYSFIQMSKCCVSAVHDYAYNRCDSVSCRLTVVTKKYLSFAKIVMYEWFLSMFNLISSLRRQLMVLMIRHR